MATQSSCTVCDIECCDISCVVNTKHTLPSNPSHNVSDRRPFESNPSMRCQVILSPGSTHLPPRSRIRCPLPPSITAFCSVRRISHLPERKEDPWICRRAGIPRPSQAPSPPLRPCPCSCSRVYHYFLVLLLGLGRLSHLLVCTGVRYQASSVISPNCRPARGSPPRHTLAQPSWTPWRRATGTGYVKGYLHFSASSRKFV